MGKRILSTFLLWSAVILCVVFLGPQGGIWLATLIGVLTQREFYQMVRRMGLEPFDRVGLALGALIMLAPVYFPDLAAPGTLLALSVIVFSLRILGEREPHNRVETLAWSLFGLVYVPFMLQFLVRIILIEGPHAATGLVFALWLIAVSKFCDVGALLTGLAFGKHKMAPGISPKKTWEGAVGGLLTSAGLGALLAHLFPHYLPSTFTPLLAAAVALPLAALAIVSDLVESIIKRRADTKDSGTTIPGIGGIFDLSDSLILTAPLGYIVFSLL